MEEKQSTGPCLFQRRDDPSRGRHLVAARRLEKGRLILAERPLLVQQSLDNLRHNRHICHGCKAFLLHDGVGLRELQGEEAAPNIVPCRHNCGHVYCSTACEQDTYAAHHGILCTGPAITTDEPVVQFKQFCIETNEILLLVAEWWIAQHHTATITTDNDTATTSSPYSDFCMLPWWDVVALGYSDAGREKVQELQEQCKWICTTAAKLLNAVFTAAATSTIPAITAWDISIRVGACEQNAMGVRQRSPWCRAVFDPQVREQNWNMILENLEEAGFLGEEGESDGDADVDDGDASIRDGEEGSGKQESSSPEPRVTCMSINSGEEEAVGFTSDDLTKLLLDLRIDEDGSVRDLAVPEEHQVIECVGDDMDLIFPPLDGTAMYSITCKMNHSCNPNVSVVYRRQPGWGSQYPLAAFCVAQRDIAEGEELTISYIDANEPYTMRQKKLQDYGFNCTCSRCEQERSGTEQSAEHAVDTHLEADLFGDDSDDEQQDADDGVEEEEEDTPEIPLEEKLQNRLNRLDSVANYSKFGNLPPSCYGSVSSFVLQSCPPLLSSDGNDESEQCVRRLLQSCCMALEGRDYSLAKIVGYDLEKHLMAFLSRNGEWKQSCPLISPIAYWCGCLTLSVGYSHDYDFLRAQSCLDKATALGLPTQHVEGYLSYVSHFADLVHRGPIYHSLNCTQLLDYRDPAISSGIEQRGLAKPIQHPIAEDSIVFFTSNGFKTSEYYLSSNAVVLRQFASDWSAVGKWRSLDYLTRIMGHRLFPVELGSMQKGSMSETFLSFRSFVETFLVPSASRRIWSLDDCAQTDAIAYLAQHPLLTQVPALKDDLGAIDAICGREGPSHINAWIGTGGTQTPLHFDSYDNILVQLVGIKYVRLYRAELTNSLYVTKNSPYGAQGNMSALRCEQEDFDLHPKAKDLEYTEAVLYPGDVLFIPSGMWHYVRSLSTSLSINFWF